MPTGYSDTPLARKLSLKPGMRVWFEDMPSGVQREIGELGLIELTRLEPDLAAAHVFVRDRRALEAAVDRVRPCLASSGFVWISWPKKASKIATDLTEDVIRTVALPTGLVDVKVCAVDATWSALKLMIRRELR